jgi:thimet oligopeptidase
MADPHVLPDYSRVTPASIRELTEKAIAAADRRVASAERATPRTFAVTLQPLEDAATIVADAYGRGAFLARVHPDTAVRDAAIDAEEQITKWSTELVFRPGLYTALTGYGTTAEAEGLTGPRRRLLDHWLRDLERAGHGLDPGEQERLRRLRHRLIELEVQFGRNLDEWQDGLDVSSTDLDGLPTEYIESLEPGSTPETRRVTLDYPDYQPFMQQARRRDLRRALHDRFWNRAAEANVPLLTEAIQIRHQIAQLLGHSSWAHHAMEVKMARDPSAVEALYESIVPALEAGAAEELAMLRARFAVDNPDDELQSWDWSYYHFQQLREDCGVDPNVVAEYLPLEATIDGMFSITGEVFGLEYHRVDDPAAWHDDVILYEIRNAGGARPLAYFYADLFPRDGKYGHAAAFPLVYGRALPDGSYRPPVAAIVANFTRPSGDRPSLLRHTEALTLFHEFGHILHFCLTRVPLIRFSGFDTEWDFVEAPSQILEHWMWRPKVLRRFAEHYRTGDPIPEDLVDRLVAARDLNIALHTLRQVFLGRADLMLHDGRADIDLEEITRAAWAYTQLPYPEGTNRLASFGHLMGGYDAGYYGYLWAKVYGDDMFSVFQEEGVLNPAVGERYRREVLEQGGARDAIEHLRRFLGREPSSDAFLRNLGIVTAESD